MDKIQAHLSGEIISSNSSDAYALFEKSRFGERADDKIRYSFYEALFLVERGKMDVVSKNEVVQKKELVKKMQKFDARFQTKYSVFKDLREKGYVVKTALKFGADFRVYEKGEKIGESHSKWIVFADFESNKMTWHDFSAKNRVAHSTKKNLLLAIVDDEGDVTYYEVRWIKT